MKKYYISIIVVILVVIVAVISFNRRHADVNDFKVSIDSSSINATSTASSTIAGEMSPLAGNISSSTNVGLAGAKETKTNFTFVCNKTKTIEAVVYSGGKNPRADITLIDNTDPEAAESRKISLPQQPASVGLRFGDNRNTTSFTLINEKATFEESGKSTFRNCAFSIASSER